MGNNFDSPILIHHRLAVPTTASEVIASDSLTGDTHT